MAGKVVKLTLRVSLADEQGPMFDSTNEWTDLPYAIAVMVEQKLVGILADLTEVGKADAAANAEVKA